MGRNYQMMLQTIPGFSPPRNAHSVPANPTRAVRFSVNGTSEQSNNVRIDGASNYNPNLTHMQGINPALESIEVVNVVTNSFDAEQGLAGGASAPTSNALRYGLTAPRARPRFLHRLDSRTRARPFMRDPASCAPRREFVRQALPARLMLPPELCTAGCT